MPVKAVTIKINFNFNYFGLIVRKALFSDYLHYY